MKVEKERKERIMKIWISNKSFSFNDIKSISSRDV